MSHSFGKHSRKIRARGASTSPERELCTTEWCSDPQVTSAWHGKYLWRSVDCKSHGEMCDEVRAHRPWWYSFQRSNSNSNSRREMATYTNHNENNQIVKLSPTVLRLPKCYQPVGRCGYLHVWSSPPRAFHPGGPLLVTDRLTIVGS